MTADQIKRLRARVLFIRSLRWETVLYLLGILTFGGWIVTSITLMSAVARWLATALLMTFALFGLAIETHHLLRNDSNKKRARALVAAIVAGSLFVSRLWARQTINDITSLDPSKFEMGLWSVTISNFPMVFFLGANLALATGFLLLLLGTVVWSQFLRGPWSWMRGTIVWRVAFSRPPLREKRGAWLVLWGRLAGLLSAATIAASFLSGVVSPAYRKHHRWLASQIFVRVEYLRKTHCNGVSESERVAFINNEVISVARETAEGFNFSTRRCSGEAPNRHLVRSYNPSNRLEEPSDLRP